MIRFLTIALLGALLGTGCERYTDGRYAIENSTWRIEEPKPNTKGDVKIDVFADRSACRNAPEVDPKDLDACVPQVDRANGHVSLSFRILDKKTSDALYLPLSQEQVDVAHLGSPRPPGDWELIQRDPMRAGQLFIILIDGTSSIYRTGGIEKIRKALNTPAVMDAFLPEGDGAAPSAVMLLRWHENVTTLDGKDPLTDDKAIIEKRSVYEKMVKNHLTSNKSGYSFTYDAVTFATTKLLDAPEVKNWLQVNSASATIVLLTDGFNNENPKDTCASNVDRLQRALDSLVRTQKEGGPYKPTLYTVGLGKAMQPKFVLPAGGNVSESALCKHYAEERIDGHLEEVGIDNPSLAWMAEFGGGKSFVRNNHKGLADVFLEAAAQRYKWYTVKYRIDSFYQRRSFDVRFRLKSYAQAETVVWLHPSAWMDAPSGEIPAGGRWAQASPLRRSMVPLMTILGTLISLTYLGPALFNARRALFRRARRK